jgi:serine/threonine-protein kinase
MSIQPHDNWLVERWKELVARGLTYTPERFCREHDCLHLLHELELHIDRTAPSSGNGEPHRKPPVNPHAPTVGPDATTPLPPAPAGLSVPGYDILGELGRGGQGVVYKAWQKNLHRPVALKIIRDGVLAGPQQVDNFESEAKVLASLPHANIVQIFDFGVHNAMPFFSMELVEGGSLTQKLEGLLLPPIEAARLLETLARAVQHAHQRKIIHRDLKPHNVLLTLDGNPKITDFGLAKRLDTASTTFPGLKGTPCYMAPEQALGVGKIGPAVDIYTLGVILYEALAGQVPFTGNTWAEIFDRLRYERPRPPRELRRDVPGDLEVICLRCLEKEPQRRYATATALADDLAAFLRGQPIQPPRKPESVIDSWVSRIGYELVTQLEQRGPIALFRARCHHTGRMAYLKVLSSRANGDKQDDMQHEMQVLRTLRHPGVPVYYGGGELDGRL